VLFLEDYFVDIDEEVQQLSSNKEHPFVRESIALNPRRGFGLLFCFGFVKKQCRAPRGADARG
jgi:hypothetical protein